MNSYLSRLLRGKLATHRHQIWGRHTNSFASTVFRLLELESRVAPVGSLVHDINSQPAGSDPGSFAEINGIVYFAANDGIHGRELWRSDGTEKGTYLVRDIDSALYGGMGSPESSNPTDLVNWNGTLFFAANDGVKGRELWKSDGTKNGTVRVKDICPGPDSSGPRYMTISGGTLYFAANDGINGLELWKTTGEDAATTLVENLRAGAASAEPKSLTDVNGALYFSADDGINGRELWRSNGSTASLIDVKAGPESSDPKWLTNVGGKLFFNAKSGNLEVLWRCDGNAATTSIVKEVLGPSWLTNVNGTLYFSGYDGSQSSGGHGSELWMSNGTESGTVLVKDINIAIWHGDAEPRYLTNVNGTLYFTANTVVEDGSGASVTGHELWMTNGTEQTTIMVAEIVPGVMGSNPWSLINVNGVLYFEAGSDDNRGLWTASGSGVSFVTTVRMASPINVNGTVIFRGTDQLNQLKDSEIWRSNGSEGSTKLVKDIRGTDSSNPRYLTEVNGTLYFAADDGVHGTELWKTFGSPLRTELVKDVEDGSGGSSPKFLTNVDGTLYFTANDGVNGWELWKSNGTSEGTVLVKNIGTGDDDSNPRYLTNINGTLFFRAFDAANGWELWKSNGTEPGTVLVADLRSGPSSSNPYQLTNVNGTLFFEADNGINGFELWKTDGEQTVLVKDIRTGSASSYPFRLTNVNGTLFFRCNDGVTGYELWKSDGTEENTVPIKDIRPGPASSNPQQFALVNDTLYFQANDGARGWELWKSQGTAATTVLVKDIRSGSGSGYPVRLTDVNGTLFFQANDGVRGYELWKSDGTAAKTVLVKDIRSGGESSYPSWLTKVGGKLFFTADDGSNGRELWTSDGTTAGTFLETETAVGPGSGNPSQLRAINDALFFSGADTKHGRELWRTSAVSRPDIVILDATTRVASRFHSIRFQYAINFADAPSSFDVKVYLSSNETYEPDQDGNPLGSLMLKGKDLTGHLTPPKSYPWKTLTIPSPTNVAITKEKPFLIVVADPDNKIAESDDTDDGSPDKNNSAFVIPLFYSRQKGGYSPTTGHFQLSGQNGLRKESQFAGAIQRRISRGTDDFELLRSINALPIRWAEVGGTIKNEEAAPYQNDDLFIDPHLVNSLDRLAELIGLVKGTPRLPTSELVLTESFDEQGEHANDSLHYEGRAVDFRGERGATDIFRRLAGLAMLAGFDWIENETNHVHASGSGIIPTEVSVESLITNLQQAITFGCSSTPKLITSVELAADLSRLLDDVRNASSIEQKRSLVNQFIKLVKTNVKGLSGGSIVQGFATGVRFPPPDYKPLANPKVDGILIYNAKKLLDKLP